MKAKQCHQKRQTLANHQNLDPKINFKRFILQFYKNMISDIILQFFKQSKFSNSDDAGKNVKQRV